MPPAAEPVRLPNGNFHVPRVPGRQLDPLSPENAFTGQQKQRLADLFELELRPLKNRIAELEAKAGIETPPEAPAAQSLKATAHLAKEPAPEKEIAKKPRNTREKNPATPGTLSAPAKAVLDAAGGAALKKQVLAQLTADGPEAVNIARARGLVAAAARGSRVGADVVEEE